MAVRGSVELAGLGLEPGVRHLRNQLDWAWAVPLHQRVALRMSAALGGGGCHACTRLG